MTGTAKPLRIDVSPDVLRWAIERSGTAIDSVIARSPEHELWMLGGCQPTWRQLEAF